MQLKTAISCNVIIACLNSQFMTFGQEIITLTTPFAGGYEICPTNFTSTLFYNFRYFCLVDITLSRKFHYKGRDAPVRRIILIGRSLIIVSKFSILLIFCHLLWSRWKCLAYSSSACYKSCNRMARSRRIIC